MDIDRASGVLRIKLVYDGPGLAGKTTNAEMVHERTRASTPLATATVGSVRALSFTTRPSLPPVDGLVVECGVFVVPRGVYFDPRRKDVYAGTDGVVFVAHSQRDHLGENEAILRDLEANLAASGLDPTRVPLVFQWNKRDLPDAAPVEELSQLVNPRRVPAFEAVAVTGEGVLETFLAVARLAAGVRSSP